MLSSSIKTCWLLLPSPPLCLYLHYASGSALAIYFQVIDYKWCPLSISVTCFHACWLFEWPRHPLFCLLAILSSRIPFYVSTSFKKNKSEWNCNLCLLFKPTAFQMFFPKDCNPHMPVKCFFLFVFKISLSMKEPIKMFGKGRFLQKKLGQSDFFVACRVGW